MINIQDILVRTIEQFITQIFEFVPKLIASLFILIIGIVIAKILAKTIKVTLKKAGIDTLGKKLNEIDIIKNFGELELSTIISSILYYFVLLIFITASTEFLGLKVLTDLVQSIVVMVPKVIAAGVMLLIGILIANAIKNIIITICKSLKIESGKLLGNVVFFFFLVISVIASLKQASIETSLLESSFNILIGGVIFAFAFGYGLASKDILANILASFYSKKDFKEGQTIEIEGVKGIIIELNKTSLVLETEASKTIFPLSILQSKKVIIYS